MCCSPTLPRLEVPYRELGLPSGETCRRRLEEWVAQGLLERALVILQAQLREAERLDWSRVIVDASLVEAKKGAARSRARSGQAGQPLPPSRRRETGCRSRCGSRRQRERTAAPAAACRRALARGIQPRELWADRGYDSRRSNKHCASAGSSHGSAGAGGRASRSHTGIRTRRYGGADNGPQDPRPARPSPLARRTHQRLAQSSPPDRHPPRPQTRQLPRLPPARDDPHPREIILRQAPDT